MKKMGWVLPTLVGVGVGFGLGWYVKSMQKPESNGTTGLYGYHHGDHFGAVMLPGEGQAFRDQYMQAALPGRRAMGLGAAYASIPGMAHFPAQAARAGYRNAMGY